MEESNLKSVLDSQVNSKRLKSLLRKYKEIGEGEIKIGNHKADVIQNVLSGINQEIIPKSEVLNLIHESEDFGNHRIYLFKSVRDETSMTLSEGISVRNCLIGDYESNGYPKVFFMPDDVVWSGFRINENRTSEWFAKLYSKLTKYKQDSTTYDNAGNKFIKYTPEEARQILSAIWDGSNTLEYRVSRTQLDNKGNMSDSLHQLDESMSNAFIRQDDFVPIDLKPAMTKFVQRHEENSHFYHLFDVKLVDVNGKSVAKIGLVDSDDGHLMANNSSKNAVQSYIENNGYSNGIVLRFLASGSSDQLSEDVNVAIGTDQKNQITIPAKLSPKDYNYVRRKIKEFM